MHSGISFHSTEAGEQIKPEMGPNVGSWLITDIRVRQKNGDKPVPSFVPVGPPFLPVPSIYSIGPPNGGSALRHGHHFEPADFEINQGRGYHDAHSAESCQRTLCMGMWLPAVSTPPQIVIDRSPAEVVRPRDARNDDASHRPWARKQPFRNWPAERLVHTECPCRATSGSSNRDNNRGMSQECAANTAR